MKKHFLFTCMGLFSGLFLILFLAALKAGAQSGTGTPIGGGPVTVLDTIKLHCSTADISFDPSDSRPIDATCGQKNGMFILCYTCDNVRKCDTIKGLAPGTYRRCIVYVGIGYWCWTETIGNKPGPAVALSRTNATCGQCDGSATVYVSGGTPPYTYSWPGGTLTGLCPGTYFGTVTDATGCTTSFSVVIDGCQVAPVDTTRTGAKGQLNISGAYPNPFSDHTKVHFYSADKGNATVAIYNAVGSLERRFGTIAEQGENTIEITGKGLPPGIHYVRITYAKSVVMVRVLKLE